MTAKRTASWHMIDNDSWVVYLKLDGLDVCTYRSTDFDDVQQVATDWMVSGIHPDDL